MTFAAFSLLLATAASLAFLLGVAVCALDALVPGPKNRGWFEGGDDD